METGCTIGVDVSVSVISRNMIIITTTTSNTIIFSIIMTMSSISRIIELAVVFIL